jgi:hypothetical protein
MQFAARHDVGVLGRRASLLVLLLGASCSLTSLDGLTGGAAEGDAGTDATRDVDPVPPGAADGAGDATPNDASVDSGFCSSGTYTFCVDFGARIHSGGVATSTDFENAHPESAAAPVLDTATFTSPPSAARFDVTPSGTRSYLFRTFPVPTPRRIELAMSLRVDGPDDADIDLMEIRFGGLDAALYLSLEGEVPSINHAYGKADGGRETDSIPLGPKMPRATWSRVGWVVETGASPTLSVTIDGTPVLTGRALAPFTARDGVTLVAGCTDSDPQGATVRIWADDVSARF